MLRLLTVLSGLMLVMPTAGAEPSSAVAFDVARVMLLKVVAAARGEALAKEGKC